MDWKQPNSSLHIIIMVENIVRVNLQCQVYCSDEVC